jgi:hypothetical protein
MDTMQAVASDGVTAQSDIDAALATAWAAGSTMMAVTIRGIQLGMIGGVAAKRHLAAVRAAQGKIAEAMGAYADLHAEQTKICKTNNVDTGDLTTAGGIAVPLGGGR